MSQVTRRTLAFGAAMVLGATAIAAPVAAQDEPQQGGTIVYGDWQAASQLNPHMTNTVANFQGIYPSWVALLDINNEGEYFPELLSEVPSVENGGLEIGDDGSFAINLNLKPDLKWSDGMPLTLNDHKWNLEWATEMLKSGVGCGRCASMVPLVDPSIEDIETLYAPENQLVESYDISEDGLTATVTWREPYAAWRDWLASYAIIPPQFWKDIPYEDVTNTAVVGSPVLPDIPASGPFVITGSSGEGIDYAPNPEYTAQEGPYLDGLRYRFFGSKDGMITAFLNGEIDLAFDMTQADFPAVAQVSPDIGRADADPTWSYEHLDLNFLSSDVGLDDPLVRQAIAHAIDKNAILEVLFPGVPGAPACSTAPPGSWWQTDVVITCPEYDPEKSMALLDEAGWTVNPDTGLREKDGNALRLKMCTSSGNPTRLTTLGVVNQQLSEVGIPTDIQTEDATSVYFADWADTTPDTECSIYRGTYDIADFAWVMTGDLYSDNFFVYHSSQIPSDANPSGYNNSRVADPAMDAALEGLATLIDPEEQKAAIGVVQQTIIDTNTEIPLYYRAETTGVSNRVGGYERYNPSTAGATWDTERWFVKE